MGFLKGSIWVGGGVPYRFSEGFHMGLLKGSIWVCGRVPYGFS